MTEFTIPLQPMVREMTLTVRITGRRQFAARAWIASRLMAVTAWVIGTKLQLTATLDDEATATPGG